MIEGWDTLRDMLKATDFTEFKENEAIIVKMVGESPTLALMCVQSPAPAIQPLLSPAPRCKSSNRSPPHPNTPG